MITALISLITFGVGYGIGTIVRLSRQVGFGNASVFGE